MNQIKNNPFPYSEDHKRYYTFSYYLKSKYHQKCAKIPLNADFTCPNRDGSKGRGGCTFCSSLGSGDTILNYQESLWTQFDSNLQRARSKWPDCLAIAYFQSYSNTYAPLEKLKKVYTPFYQSDKVTEICIATRADCLDEEKIAWFASQPKETWIEIGLQSSNENTTRAINRAHSNQDVIDAVNLSRKYGLKTCIHIINGLPGDSKEDMLNTARFAASLQCDAIKIHMLHLIDNSLMGAQYKLNPFPLLSMEEYVDIVCDQLELLPMEMIVERVTGDGVQANLIAPLWTARKTITANEIDKELFRRNSWQSKYYSRPAHKHEKKESEN